MGTRMGSFPGTELLLKSKLWNLVYRLMVLGVRQDANKAIYTNGLLSVVSVYNCTLTFRKEVGSIGKSYNKQMGLLPGQLILRVILFHKKPPSYKSWKKGLRD